VIKLSRFSILQSFYNTEKWKKFRLGLIAERGNKCQKCGKVIIKSVDITGHHKTELTPENVNDVMISLNPENVLLVCYECHNEIHHRYGHTNKDRKVYIVYGSPMSGKTTFVKQQMKRGDIVVDMDRLYEAVSMLPCFDKPDGLLSNVLGIHNLLIDNIKTRYGKWNNAWVIGGYADKYKREKMANDLGAELVFIDTPKEECLYRLEMDEDRQYRQDEWRGYVNRWFDIYKE
jgi:hypothetical protein